MILRIFTTIGLCVVAIFLHPYIIYTIGILAILYFSWYIEGFIIILIHFLMYNTLSGTGQILCVIGLLVIYLTRNLVLNKFLRI